VRDGEVYALRIAASAAQRPSGRTWECRVLERVAAAGLAPAVAYCDPAAGILITRWVPGRSWMPPRQESGAARIAALLQRIHAVTAPQPPRKMTPVSYTHLDVYKRQIHSAATSEANIFTARKSTISRLAIAAPSTSQSSRNQRKGVAMARFAANGCSIVRQVRRERSATGDAGESAKDGTAESAAGGTGQPRSGGDGSCIMLRSAGERVNRHIIRLRRRRYRN